MTPRGRARTDMNGSSMRERESDRDGGRESKEGHLKREGERWREKETGGRLRCRTALVCVWTSDD